MIQKLFLCALFLVIAGFCMPAIADAATLSFTNASGIVGKTFSVSVLVSATDGESLNGVSAHINYPADKLSLLSISKSGSIITFWAEEPSFSNTSGSASMDGIIPNPGFSGRGGRVATLVFQARVAGTATISFGSDSSVLANDGQGTNVLTSASSLNVPLSSAAAPAVPPATPATTAAPKKATTTPAKPKPAGSKVATSTPSLGLSITTEAGALATVTPAALELAPETLPSHTAFEQLLILILAGFGLVALGIASWFGIMRLLALHRVNSMKSGTLVHRSFALLKSDLEKEIARLHANPEVLSSEEADFLAQFKKDLQEVERLVEKRLPKK